MVNYTRRLETPRLVKSIEEMCDAARGTRYPIGHRWSFRSASDRRAMGVFHQMIAEQRRSDIAS
jgi:hypothetical protein